MYELYMYAQCQTRRNWSTVTGKSTLVYTSILASGEGGIQARYKNVVKMIGKIIRKGSIGNDRIKGRRNGDKGRNIFCFSCRK
jgi:hypothetical protein